jgi:hypothetical protein
MFAHAHDHRNLIRVAIYSGKPSREALTRATAKAREMTHLAWKRPHVKSRIVFVWECGAGSLAHLLSQITETHATLPPCDFALVTPSATVRATMNVVTWPSRNNPERKQQVFASYELARAWLVFGGARGEQLDTLCGLARKQLSDQAWC